MDRATELATGPWALLVTWVLCEVIEEPIKRLAQLIGEPIKLTGKRALRKALPEALNRPFVSSGHRVVTRGTVDWPRGHPLKVLSCTLGCGPLPPRGEQPCGERCPSGVSQEGDSRAAGAAMVVVRDEGEWQLDDGHLGSVALRSEPALGLRPQGTVGAHVQDAKGDTCSA